MTISKRTIQFVAAGATIGLFFLCSLIAGGVSFFLPAQKNYGLTFTVACLPMLIGLGLAVAAYFVAGRMIKDDTESSTAPAPAFSQDEHGGLMQRPGLSKRGIRWLLVGLIIIFVIGLNVISVYYLGAKGWGFLIVQALLAAGGSAIYIIARQVRKMSSDWMDETGWPMISVTSVVVMAILFVIFVGGPALGSFIGGWFVERQPANSASGMKILGNVLGYAVWIIIVGLSLYLTIDRHPSKGVIIVTISLPILVLAAFFGFGLVEWAVAYLWAGMAFAKSWLLYAIFAAILTAIFADQTKLWEAEKALPIALVTTFIVTSVISWAILASVGATFGMYGQGATIIAVVISYGIYLSWERSNMSGGGGL